MAIVYCEDFEYVATGSPEVSVRGRATGVGNNTFTGGDPIPATGGIRSYGMPTSETRYYERPFNVQSGGAAFYFYLGSGTSSGIIFDVIDPTASGGAHMTLRHDGYGRLWFQRGRSVEVYTSPHFVYRQRWAHIEVKWTIDDVAGFFAIRMGGSPASEVSFSGDTRSGGALGGTAIRWSGNTNTHYVDKIVVWNTTGPRDNDWVGECDVITLLPNGPGAFAQWTPSAGANWQNVDEVVSDSDTSYNSTTTVGLKDRFTFENLPSTAVTVKGVQVSNWYRRTDAVARSSASLAYDGTTEAQSSTYAANTGNNYYWRTRMFADHPSGAAAWTPAEVDAGEFGYISVV